MAVTIGGFGYTPESLVDRTEKVQVWPWPNTCTSMSSGLSSKCWHKFMKAARCVAAMWPEELKDGAVRTQGDKTRSAEERLAAVGSLMTFTGDWMQIAGVCGVAPRRTMVSACESGPDAGARNCGFQPKACGHGNRMFVRINAPRPEAPAQHVCACIFAFIRTETNEGRPASAASDAANHYGPTANPRAANRPRTR